MKWKLKNKTKKKERFDRKLEFGRIIDQRSLYSQNTLLNLLSILQNSPSVLHFFHLIKVLPS